MQQQREEYEALPESTPSYPIEYMDDSQFFATPSFHYQDVSWVD